MASLNSGGSLSRGLLVFNVTSVSTAFAGLLLNSSILKGWAQINRMLFTPNIVEMMGGT